MTSGLYNAADRPARIGRAGTEPATNRPPQPDGRDVVVGDYVCWAQPPTLDLHEGIVRRAFDRFVEVEDFMAGATTVMVYRHRLMVDNYPADYQRNCRQHRP